MSSEVLEGAGVDLEERVISAVGRCVARWGMNRTSVDDVAGVAGVSRATVYRMFPGGKKALVERAAHVEVDRFFEHFTSRLDAAVDIRTWLEVGLADAGAAMSGDAPVRVLLLATMDVEAPGDPFSGLNKVLALIVDAAVPFAARFIVEGAQRRVVEWIARLALSYASTPSPDYDLRDPDDVGALVADFVLPSVAVHLTPDASDTLGPGGSGASLLVAAGAPGPEGRDR